MLDAGDVVLRPYEDRDRGPLKAILCDPAVMALALHERAFRADEAEAFIADHFGSTNRLTYESVTLKSTGDVIGFSGCRACRYLGDDDVEFGWVLAKEHHGRGYATALGEVLIHRALGPWGLPRVLGACSPDNHASERVLRDKLHMRFERQVEPRSGFHRRVYSAAAGWSRVALYCDD